MSGQPATVTDYLFNVKQGKREPDQRIGPMKTTTKIVTAVLAALAFGSLAACTQQAPVGGNRPAAPAPPPPAQVIVPFGTPWNPVPNVTLTLTATAVPQAVDYSSAVNSRGEHQVIPAHLKANLHADNRSAVIVGLGYMTAIHGVGSTCTTANGQSLNSSEPGLGNDSPAFDLLPGRSGDSNSNYALPAPDTEVQCHVYYNLDDYGVDHVDAYFTGTVGG